MEALTGAADRPRPPRAAAPPPVTDHVFAPYTYDNRTFCIEPVRGHTCDRPEAEHERVPDNGWGEAEEARLQAADEAQEREEREFMAEVDDA